MPIKEEKKRETEETILSKLKELLVDKFSHVVVENISYHIHNLMLKLQNLVYHTQKKIIEQFYVSAFFFAGCIFVAASLLFYLIDTLQWSRSKAALVTGILLLITSGVTKYYIKQTRFMER